MIKCDCMKIYMCVCVFPPPPSHGMVMVAILDHYQRERNIAHTTESPFIINILIHHKGKGGPPHGFAGSRISKSF